MKLTTTGTNLLNIDFSLERKETNLLENIYALKVLNVDKNIVFEIAIKHDGYCPNISSDYEESKFNEYLCALEHSLINEYFKINKIKTPKSYYSICEVITNDKGELYRYSKSTN